MANSKDKVDVSDLDNYKPDVSYDPTKFFANYGMKLSGKPSGENMFAGAGEDPAAGLLQALRARGQDAPPANPGRADIDFIEKGNEGKPAAEAGYAGMHQGMYQGGQAPVQLSNLQRALDTLEASKSPSNSGQGGMVNGLQWMAKDAPTALLRLLGMPDH